MKVNMDSICVCCGDYVPEGTMVCPNCIANGGPISSCKEKEKTQQKMKRNHIIHFLSKWKA